MPDHVIKVEQISKRYHLYGNSQSGPLMSILFPKSQSSFPSFLAVDNVSFSISAGEVIGILGRNGSGKTTLLKIIAGLLAPDKGTIDVHGDITLLLALGVGVHPEFTGRENIIYGAMLLGMPKKEILKKMDSIIDFSEIGPFIDQPFRTYSSGMKSRVLFSTAISVDPEILILDEALATGDVMFVNKCMKRIRELCRSGATVIFVSHNLREMQDLCSRCILMECGKLICDDTPQVVIPRYLSLTNEPKN